MMKDEDIKQACGALSLNGLRAMLASVLSVSLNSSAIVLSIAFELCARHVEESASKHEEAAEEIEKADRGQDELGDESEVAMHRFEAETARGYADVFREYQRKAIGDRYHDESYPERACDRCGEPYQGPAVYCSIQCAVADA